MAEMVINKKASPPSIFDHTPLVNSPITFLLFPMYITMTRQVSNKEYLLEVIDKKGGIMPWHNGDYPPSYKNQPKKIRDKATEIANEVLKTTRNEGKAIATGLKQARIHFANEKVKKAE